VPIRVPPGRSGRLWLVRKLEIAARGAAVLDQKRQALLRDRQRLAMQLAEAEALWEPLARAAAAWNDRALALVGPRRLRLASLHGQGRAEVTVEWRNALGVVHPVEASVRIGATPDFVALGGSASVARAAAAHAEALAAAAAVACARAAYDAISSELAATTRRLRAIEHRWIPAHAEALRSLELALDQQDLEDAVRVRWAHGAKAGTGTPVE
jgi:V/A-type H+-transporting ATPase subunit D